MVMVVPRNASAAMGVNAILCMALAHAQLATKAPSVKKVRLRFIEQQASRIVSRTTSAQLCAQLDNMSETDLQIWQNYMMLLSLKLHLLGLQHKGRPGI